MKNSLESELLPFVGVSKQLQKLKSPVDMPWRVNLTDYMIKSEKRINKTITRTTKYITNKVNLDSVGYMLYQLIISYNVPEEINVFSYSLVLSFL